MDQVTKAHCNHCGVSTNHRVVHSETFWGWFDKNRDDDSDEPIDASDGYTKEYFGKSVTLAAFQAAMEQASGRDLSACFSEWVYQTPR